MTDRLRVRLLDLAGTEVVVDCSELAFLVITTDGVQPTPRQGLLLLNPAAYRLIQFCDPKADAPVPLVSALATLGRTG